MDALAEPRLAVGIFRKLKHLVDADAYIHWHEGIPLYFARCGAISIPTTSPGPCSWCRLCQPEEPSWPKSEPTS